MQTYFFKTLTFSLVILASLSQVACQNSETTLNVSQPESSIVPALNNKFPEAKPNEDWKKILSDEQYKVMVEKGTETPFNNEFNDKHRKGTYVSAATGEPLFRSEDKFESGTGWPSFTKPISEEAVLWIKDNSLGMTRDEIVETSTGLHLGHVFNDGPEPTGLRYCMNSAALKFVEDK